MGKSGSANTVEDATVPVDKTMKTKAADAADEEAGNNDKAEKEPPPKSKRSTKILVVTVSIIVLVAVVVVAVLLTYDGNKGSKNSNEAVAAPSSTPPVAPSQPIFGVPTSMPVAEPTSSQITTLPTPLPIVVDPTPAPSVSTRTQLASFLSVNGVVVDETNPASAQALTFLVDEATLVDSSDPEKIIQRYALLTLDFGLAETTSSGGQGESSTNATFVNEGGRYLEELEAERKLQTPLPLGSSGLDECLWAGVTCSNSTVVELRLGSKGYTGSIPAEIGLLTALTHLDISQNQIGGSIPEEMYRLTNLQALYMYKNQLTGTISSSASNWFDMIQLHLSHNLLTGSIPSTLTPMDGVFRSFELVNLKNNNLSGSIPSGLRWRQLFLLDLGFNKLTGTLPVDLGETFGSLRHLFLDHNQFVGTLPESYITVGNGRLESLAINDNFLTGQVPDNHVMFNKLVMFTMQNNDFNVALRDTCKLDVFEGGEAVEVTADCDICSCDKGAACSNC